MYLFPAPHGFPGSGFPVPVVWKVLGQISDPRRDRWGNAGVRDLERHALNHSCLAIQAATLDWFGLAVLAIPQSDRASSLGQDCAGGAEVRDSWLALIDPSDPISQPRALRVSVTRRTRGLH